MDMRSVLWRTRQANALDADTKQEYESGEVNEVNRIMARPSKYKPEYANQAGKLCGLGATDKDIAEFFDVSEQTLNAWKKSHPEFLESLKVSKKVEDERVEQSLFNRALGYEHDDTDIRVVANQIIKTKLRKYYPPDTTACIFWLKNRQPEKWREMKAVELTGKDGGAVVLHLSSTDANL